MSTLRLSTLSLILAIAVFSLAFLGFSVPAAAHPCEREAGHKHCDVEGPQTTYTVELVGRVFDFGPPVTVKEDGKLVPDPAVPLTFSRPGGGIFPCPMDSFHEACLAWDAVFAACENFFGTQPILGPTPVTVSGFEVSADNWQVQKPGGVRLQTSILFDINGNSPPENGGPYMQVSLQLIGDTLFENPNSPWLPDAGETIEYSIFDFSIVGKTVKGVRPKKGCVSGGSAEDGDFDPGQVRTLVITAPAAE